MSDTEAVVFVIDDDLRSRESIRAMVGTMNLKAQTFASAEAFLEVYSGEPGCLVTDLRMPGRSAVELLAELNARNLMLPTIVISAFAEVSVAVEAMQQGAMTLLEKPYRENELWNAVREALQQDAVTRSAREEGQRVRAKLELLTEREQGVLELILDGVPNKAIATRLDIGLRTVESRRQSVFEKLGVDSVAQLVQQVMSATQNEKVSRERT